MPGDALFPFAVWPPPGGLGLFTPALRRMPVRGVALLAAGVLADGSALILLSRSAGRLLVRASLIMPVRPFGTMDALFVDGIAATAPGTRGDSSDDDATDLLIAGLRSLAALLRTSLAVTRDVADG